MAAVVVVAAVGAAVAVGAGAAVPAAGDVSEFLVDPTQARTPLAPDQSNHLLADFVALVAAEIACFDGRVAGRSIIAASEAVLPLPLPEDPGAVYTENACLASRLATPAQHPPLAALQRVFRRLRNSRGHETMLAQLQYSFFNEAAAQLFGERWRELVPEYAGFQSGVDPAPSGVFDATAWLMWRSTWTLTFMRFDSSGVPVDDGPLTLVALDMDPAVSFAPEKSLEQLLVGSVISRARAVDHMFAHETAAFRVNATHQFDWVAADLERARAAGAPTVNAARASLGLPAVASIGALALRPEIDATGLAALYSGGIDELDVGVAALAEAPGDGSTLGPLLEAVLADQVVRSRDGDPDVEAAPEEKGAVPLVAMFEEQFWGGSRVIGERSVGVFAAGTLVSTLPQVLELRTATLINERLLIKWTVDADAREIEITVRGSTTGFVGLGFGSVDGGMAKADIYVSRVVDGQVEVLDLWSKGYETPKSDSRLGGTDDVLRIIEGREVDGDTEVTFVRALDTGDRLDRPIEAGLTTLIASLGRSDRLAYHGVLNRQSATVDFTTGQVIASDTPFAALGYHAAFMLLIWGLGIPIGIFAARNMRGFGPGWLSFHRMIQAGSFTPVVAVILLAVVGENASAEEGHVNHVHGQLGVALACLGGVQIMLGLRAVAKYDPNRTHAPFFPDGLHRWVGRGVFVLSQVTAFLGMERLALPEDLRLAYVGWLVFVVVVFLAFEVAKYMGRWTNSEGAYSKASKHVVPTI